MVCFHHLITLLIIVSDCGLIQRGDAFRSSFAEIGTIRGLIPETVNVIALTATATNSTFDQVVDRLAMQRVGHHLQGTTFGMRFIL